MNSRRSIIFMLLVFAVLAVLVIMQQSNQSTTPFVMPEGTDQPLPTANPAVSDSNRIYPQLQLSDIQRIQLDDVRFGTITATLGDDGKWTLSLPDNSTVDDQTQAQAFVTQMIEQRFQSEIQGIDSSQYPQFGISDDSAGVKLEIDLKDGTTYHLLVGYLTNDQKSFYARAAESDTVYLMQDITAEGETPQPPQLLNPDWTLDNVQAIRIQAPGTVRTLVVTRSDDGTQWTIPDSQSEVNQDVLTAIVRTVVELSYTNSVAITADTSLADYGLTQSRAQLFIQVLLRSGEGHSIAIGAATPTRTAYYVLADERNEIYLVSNSPDPVAFLTHYFDEFQNSGG